jgi:hypothetical protein
MKRAQGVETVGETDGRRVGRTEAVVAAMMAAGSGD